MPATRTPTLLARDRQRLAGLHPDLIGQLLRILDAMDAYGFPMFVTHGVRTAEEQFALFQQGRRQDVGGWVPIDPATRAGIVTNADGYLKRSNHQARDDGYGHAADCAFIDDPDTLKVELYDPAQPWDVYGGMGEHLGLRWGGRWPGLRDRPHLERPA